MHDFVSVVFAKVYWTKLPCCRHRHWYDDNKHCKRAHNLQSNQVARQFCSNFVTSVHICIVVWANWLHTLQRLQYSGCQNAVTCPVLHDLRVCIRFAPLYKFMMTATAVWRCYSSWRLPHRGQIVCPVAVIGVIFR